MKYGTALMWKEWRQRRWFLFAGLVIFLGWPLFDVVVNYQPGRDVSASDMVEGIVTLFGGLFAILVAVAATCADLKDELACFWQSRPIAIGRWLVAKYLMGLAVVLVVLCLPLIVKICAIELSPSSSRSDLGTLHSLLGCHTFALILIYSIAFVTGCLIRKPVYAVILSIAGALLVYFLPLLVPPIERFSVINLMMERPLEIVRLTEAEPRGMWFAHKLRVLKIPGAGDFAVRYNTDLVGYILGVLALSCAAVVVCWFAVGRHWRLKVGKKLMFWSLGAVVLLLLLTVVFQLGSNLRCISQIPVGTDDSERDRGVAALAFDGEQGILLTYDGPNGAFGRHMGYGLRRMQLSPTGLQLGRRIAMPHSGRPFVSWHAGGKLAWSAQDPPRVYFLREQADEGDSWPKETTFYLDAVELGAEDGEVANTGSVKLGSYTVRPGPGNLPPRGESIVLHGKTIYAYVLGRLLVVDVTNPENLEVTAVVDDYTPYVAGDDPGVRRDRLDLRLVPGDGLSAEEKLEITVGLDGYRSMAIEGEVVVSVGANAVSVYRLEGIEADIAQLGLLGRRNPLPLERLIGRWPQQVLLRDGLAYVLDMVTFEGLTVYDVRQPGRIRRVGHYAAPTESFSAMAVLGDGNLLMGGTKLHVVAPPRVAKTRAASTGKSAGI
ncbi:MAG: hypothetical protein JSU70_16410 [Phycisphaerales bacterium]|nr:MAG: hypothetical protein JSU70_16410 [Phycisphaerales bacterium]